MTQRLASWLSPTSWARRVAVRAAARHFLSDIRTIAHPPEAGESPGLLGNQRPSVRVQPGPPIVLTALPTAATSLLRAD